MNDIPKHIAIIMDGNRRWARARGLPVLEGHRRVVDDILEPLVEYASTKGVEYLTFWAWSTENWKRDKAEVEGIMRLFRILLTRKIERLHKNGVRVLAIGDISGFAEDIQTSLKNAIEKTKNNKKITTIFALNYGGRDEIIRAIKKASGIKHTETGGMTLETLTPETFSQLLDTSGIPDPDFIVRTGGEQRLSGFLLWQSEYSEFYFPTWYMPEFTHIRFDEVLAEYASRKRRFGS